MLRLNSFHACNRARYAFRQPACSDRNSYRADQARQARPRLRTPLYRIPMQILPASFAANVRADLDHARNARRRSKSSRHAARWLRSLSAAQCSAKMRATSAAVASRPTAFAPAWRATRQPTSGVQEMPQQRPALWCSAAPSRSCREEKFPTDVDALRSQAHVHRCATRQPAQRRKCRRHTRRPAQCHPAAFPQRGDKRAFAGGMPRMSYRRASGRTMPCARAYFFHLYR